MPIKQKMYTYRALLCTLNSELNCAGFVCIRNMRQLHHESHYKEEYQHDQSTFM